LVGLLKGSPTRTKILKALESGPMTPKELVLRLGLHFSQVSTALKELNDAALLQSLTPNRRKGKVYSITNSGKEALAHL
jgi:DNA-binding transcriptional ArsR family regulator